MKLRTIIIIAVIAVVVWLIARRQYGDFIKKKIEGCL